MHDVFSTLFSRGIIMADPPPDDADDNDTGVDESAYDLGPAKRERDDAITMPQAAPESTSEPAPDWANKWKVEQKRPARLTGTCAKWNAAKGFGFIARSDGLGDIYVHQRDLQKKGYRTMLEGEKVEFDVSAMDDGRLHAVRVSGPGGVDVQGIPKPKGKGSDSDDDDGADDEPGASGKAAKPESSTSVTAAAARKPYAKPAFMPRAVARKPQPKPKPKAPSALAPPPPPAPQ